jgi:UDP-hydrolysing UDP-N-acetyl-D-glucosamine 2-epimerase
MKKTIGFFTGARSDYGIMKNLIREIQDSDIFEYRIYVSGIHLLDKFGKTIEEIIKDGFGENIVIIEAFEEQNEPGYFEFSKIINSLSICLGKNAPDVMFLLGDRFETYAAALACHFSAIPIIHSGGGTITKGANDNIYRYNISNLATYHFATSEGNYQRLLGLPVTENENVFFTGSFAIDAIQEFNRNPKSIHDTIPGLNVGDFCLITFHSVTKSKENVAEIMDEVILKILSLNKQALITYPNNDPGYKHILEIIEKWKTNKNVFVREHLGSIGYYAALRDCKLIIGNSSSGIVEAPYFNKTVINIGSRQEGREADESIITVPCKKNAVLQLLEEHLGDKKYNVYCNNIYGNGEALIKIRKILSDYLLPKI